MQIDTIVTDMDDTLLSGAGELSEYTLDVIRKCLERGIRFIPASGRAQMSLMPFVRRMNTGLPYIACNGAQIVNGDHTLMESLALSAETAREICRYFREQGLFVQTYQDEYVYYEEECDISLGYIRATGLIGKAVGDLQKFLTFGTPKVLCIAEPETVAALYPKARELFAGRVNFTISKPTFLEATPMGATKGEALSRLAGRIGIDPQKTLVFGDSLNDLSMLAFTENSVALGNGRDEVKQAANFVCGPNTRDGVAHFIEERVFH